MRQLTGAKSTKTHEDRLAHERLGHVSGGGLQLGDERPDGTRPIEFCGIDIDVADLGKALVALRKELVALKAPVGTELHYTKAGVRLQDELQPGEWRLERSRSFLHPGFGC